MRPARNSKPMQHLAALPKGRWTTPGTLRSIFRSGRRHELLSPGGSLLTRTGDTKRITEELRFTSEFEGRLQTTAGIFYSDDKTHGIAPCSFSVGISEASGYPFGTECMFFGDTPTEV